MLSSPKIDCFVNRNLRLEQIFPRKRLYDFLMTSPEKRNSSEKIERARQNAFKELSARAQSFVLDTGWIDRKEMKMAISDGRFESEFSKLPKYGAKRGVKTKAELIAWANKKAG